MRFRPDRSVPFVNAVYAVVAGKGSLADVSVLLGGIEERHHVFLRPFADRPRIPDAQSEAWIARHLLPFLDETHLVLCGMDVQDVDVCDRAGRQLGVSGRAWGRIVADWANRRSWPPGAPARTWSYLDFYVGGPDMLGYDDFVSVVLQAIQLDQR